MFRFIFLHLRIAMMPFVVLAALFSFTVTAAENNYPAKPIKIIVPFSPGGGSDTLARLFQQTIEKSELLPQPLIVVNVPGAGGTIGSRRARNALPDGHTILFLHEGIVTAKYSGKAPFSHQAFTPIAATGEVGAVIAVHADSEFTSLSGLLEKAKAAPETITFGSNLGAPSHFWALLLEKASDAKFRFVQTGGGSKRFGDLKGGHIQVTAFSVSEFQNFKAGGLKAVAYLGEKRHSSLPDLPTALEQNVDVTTGNIQGWWAPKNTPAQRVALLASVLKRAMADPEMQKRLAAEQIDPIFLNGEELAAELTKRETVISKIGKRELPTMPNLPLVFAVIGGIAALAALFSLKRGIVDESSRPDDRAPRLLDDDAKMKGFFRGASLAVIALTMVAALQTSPFGFKIVACVFLFFSFRLLMPSKKLAVRAKTILVALVIPFLSHWVFTKLLNVDLP
ncbi:tripartite tricarboxylate transporter substrate binding protein [Verrucomicrobiales bacterium]|nr:tripartite tricarboxylate transporter substrate binding protein [Verrucomicrobiales bacterium]